MPVRRLRLRACDLVLGLVLSVQAVDVDQIAHLGSRLGHVLSSQQLNTAAHQLLQAVESEGFSGSAAVAEALNTCESIRAVEESRTG